MNTTFKVETIKEQVIIEREVICLSIDELEEIITHYIESAGHKVSKITYDLRSVYDGKLVSSVDLGGAMIHLNKLYLEGGNSDGD